MTSLPASLFPLYLKQGAHRKLQKDLPETNKAWC